METRRGGFLTSAEITVSYIQSKIIHLPSRPPFMLVRDLAEIYGVPPAQITQAVRRNPERFPDDFAFKLRPDEVKKLVLDDVCGLQNEARK